MGLEQIEGSEASGVQGAVPSVDRTRTRRITDSLCALFWISIAIIGLLGALPEDAFGVGAYSRTIVRTLLPEGWAFFTRNPRERVDYFYEVRGNGELAAANSTDQRGPLGISRKYRLRSIELTALVGQIPESAWVSCRSSLSDCLRQTSPELSLPIMMNVPSYCGRAVIQSRQPIPWAWRKSYWSIDMPSRFVRVNAVCSHPVASRG